MKTKNIFQSSLAMDLQGYISLKQDLGRQFQDAASVLLKLDQFLCSLGQPSVDLTPVTFKQWSQTLETHCSNTRRAQMYIVRNFCLYRQRSVPDCFVPDATHFPQAGPRFQPYIFSDPEIERLLKFCACIPDSARSPLRGTATRLAIILLYTTGMRRGELLRLTERDYDPTAQTLLIRESKFYKSRLLPLPSDVATEVAKFLKINRAVFPSQDASLLCSPYCGRDRAYSREQLRTNLRILLGLAGIKKTDCRLPRIHDFRHSFAVNALVRWYRNGVDVQAKLPFLAAWLGHYSVIS